MKGARHLLRGGEIASTGCPGISEQMTGISEVIVVNRPLHSPSSLAYFRLHSRSRARLGLGCGCGVRILPSRMAMLLNRLSCFKRGHILSPVIRHGFMRHERVLRLGGGVV